MVLAGYILGVRVYEDLPGWTYVAVLATWMHSQARNRPQPAKQKTFSRAPICASLALLSRSS